MKTPRSEIHFANCSHQLVPPFLATVSGTKTYRFVVSDCFAGCWQKFALVLSPWCSMQIAVKTSVYWRHVAFYKLLYISLFCVCMFKYRAPHLNIHPKTKKIIQIRGSKIRCTSSMFTPLNSPVRFDIKREKKTSKSGNPKRGAWVVQVVPI